MRRRLIAATCAACCLPAIAGCGAGSAKSPPAAAPAVWLIGDHQLAAIAANNYGLAKRTFDNPHTYVVSTSPRDVAMPADYRSIPTVLYTSEHRFASDIEHQRLDPHVEAVIYDPEKWAKTPTAEQAHPRAAARSFANLARRQGLHPILAPGRDIVAAVVAGCAAGKGERLDHAYLRCRIPAAADGYSWLVVQAAPEELDHGATTALLQGARRQAGPTGAGLLATLSITPQGEHVWPGKLVDAAINESRNTAGLMLNFQVDDAQMAADFLRHLERRTPRRS